jgi:hypothetical protein
MYVLILYVYYLDNLLGEHSTNPELIPRIAHFRKQQLLDLIEEDKQVVNGLRRFVLYRSVAITLYSSMHFLFFQFLIILFLSY